MYITRYTDHGNNSFRVILKNVIVFVSLLLNFDRNCLSNKVLNYLKLNGNTE